MKRTCFYPIRALLALGLLLCLAVPVFADGMPEPVPYAVTGGEFYAGEDLRGIFVTAVPEENQAKMMLGQRQIRPGDVILTGDLERLALIPVTETGADVVFRFLPIGTAGPETAAVLTMHIRSAAEEAPQALDQSLETYRNIPNTGVLQAVSDNGPLSFRLESKPRRGSVELQEDGSFTYTPKKNKVGEDSFTFVATDQAGRESSPGTVRIQIRKPTDAETFADLAPESQFPALWLRENGLFGGEAVNDRLSFGPDKPVTRGEFLVMLMAMEGIEPDIGLRSSGFADEEEAPVWMRPYLASAMRRGIARGCVTENGLVFLPEKPITAAEAALMLSRVLGLEQPVSGLEPAVGPVWARGASAALNEAGILWTGDSRILTRMETARLLYQASTLD